MRRTALLAALCMLAIVLAGCTGTPPSPGGGQPGGGSPDPAAGPLVAAAPWWNVGDAPTVRIARTGQPEATYRMVNFWNDTETAHFWLGVADRKRAMDHALFDVNPFLGRIHHGILTPHERGMHAAMYSFPLSDGKTWTGFFFGGEWAFTAREADLQTPGGQDRGFRIEGVSTKGDQARVTFDYSPALRWFSELRQTDAQGRPMLVAEVTTFERDVRGTYTFLRGRDFHSGPQLPGTHDERFSFSETVDALAFFVDARASGPLEVQLVDPAGQVRARATSGAGGQARLLEEVKPPTPGEWRVRYVATGAIEGRVLVTGLLETSRTV